VFGDHSLRAALRTLFQVAQSKHEVDLTASPGADVVPVMSRDWQPFMAAAYGLLAVACLRFLAAGFTVVHHLVATLTIGAGPIPAFISFLAVVAVAAVASWPIAARQLEKIDTDPHVRQHLLWVVGISLVLLLPMTQHLTFGSSVRIAPVAQLTRPTVARHTQSVVPRVSHHRPRHAVPKRQHATPRKTRHAVVAMHRHAPMSDRSEGSSDATHADDHAPPCATACRVETKHDERHEYGHVTWLTSSPKASCCTEAFEPHAFEVSRCLPSMVPTPRRTPQR